MAALRFQEIIVVMPKALTTAEFNEVSSACCNLFIQKLMDYGPAWRHMRLLSIVDQIFIKAKRIRRLEELGGKGLIPDTPKDEYIGIVNYCVIALDKIYNRLREDETEIDETWPEEWATESIANFTFNKIVDHCREVLLRKNNDYNEAWRQMEISSMTDEILSRVERIKSIIIINDNRTLVSEGVESQLIDTLNYSILALARINSI
jgi:hypothetical protein